MHHRTREFIVVQTRDVPQRERQVHAGLPVWREEGAVFRRVLIKPHAHMESLLNLPDRALKLKVTPLTRTANDFESVLFREANRSIPIFLARSKPRGKFLPRYEVPEVLAGRIVDVLQEILEFWC